MRLKPRLMALPAAPRSSGALMLAGQNGNSRALYNPFKKDFQPRVGFAYTETGQTVYNRAVLYGLGYRFGEKWGLAFEHSYDFEQRKMTQQKYEIRRNLHCWEAALVFRDRETGWDIGLEFNIAAFPGTAVKF